MCTTTKLEFYVKTYFLEDSALVCNKVKLQTSSHKKKHKKKRITKKVYKNCGSVKSSFHLCGMNKGSVSKINAKDIPKKKVHIKEQKTEWGKYCLYKDNINH